ncbi:branched-chain amino acid transport system II carrier protein [uncultured Dokdonia sp.]|uniref:branched-chain amino acid transport system II carrier protein n=1 Tax=uncultured Dokdonia sp. TaxID=575653 RepID=UPI002639F5A2|nr:branched-chain amino acid transport system II carrier protein [uncultured Dokdonia sp.]
MKITKQTFVTSFALFSLFFGAGNLIFPSFLGYNAGDGWFMVAVGFVISAVVIPILAIYGHARLQGTMMDFGKKVSPVFAFVYSLIVYVISVSFPSPRTASVTYEMAVQPYIDIPSWGWIGNYFPLILSAIYFMLVLLFVLNRSKIIDIIGKFLTPGILIILGSIICIGLFGDYDSMRASTYASNLTSGILEGYQTFDAIGGVLVGGVLVVSLSLKGISKEESKSVIAKAGLFAGIGFVIMYVGLIALGAANSGTLEAANRTDLLSQLSYNTLGGIGRTALGVLVALACFTTAVGIVTGTADFFKGLFKDSQRAYVITAIISCILGVGMGQLDVHSIIVVALPALMFIYPITIVLILLNVLPDRYASPMVFKAVVFITVVFSLPDFLSSIGLSKLVQPIQESVPLGTVTLGWLLPAIIIFIVVNLISFKKSPHS